MTSFFAGLGLFILAGLSLLFVAMAAGVLAGAAVVTYRWVVR